MKDRVIKTRITRAGQLYVDEPVVSRPLKLLTPLSDAMAEAHGHVKMVKVQVNGKLVPKRVRTDLPADIILGYRRTWLNWV